jgi:hypothetical protein
MNFEYRIEPDRKLAIVTPVGLPDFSSSLDAIMAVASDPAFGPDFGVLCDFRELQYSPSISELSDVGRFLGMPGVFKGHKIAIVVSSTSQLALGRLLAAVANAWGTHLSVFTRIHEAELWLAQDTS